MCARAAPAAGAPGKAVEHMAGKAANGAVASKNRRRTSPRPRRVPQRTCIACRQVEGKRRLIRVVRTPAGTVEVDPTGKKNGRGAYVHADPACWDLAFKRRAFQHALKTEVPEEDRAALVAFRQTLDPPASGDTERSSSSGGPATNAGDN